MMTTIETARLLIRNFKAGDAAALHAVIRRFQASEYAAYDIPWPATREEIARVATWFAGGDNYLAVCLRETDRLIGFVALNPEPETGVYTLGYNFDSDQHGHGYATEACGAILERAFGPLQAARVIAGTAAANEPSCRLLARLGFRKTAESTTSFHQGPDGRPIGFQGYIFELTRNEYVRVDARYVHTNLIAADWRALAHFYETVFGCVRLPPERDLSGPALEAGTGIPAAHLTGAHLRLPGWGEAGPTLEIFTYEPPVDRPAARPPAERSSSAVNRPGFGHLAFSVADVPAARARVLAAGGRPVGEVVTVDVRGGGRVTWCYVADPEGNVLELQNWVQGDPG